MSNQDFTMTIIVDRSPADTFEAITDVAGWWSTGVTGGSRSQGDEFLFEVDGIHRCRMRVSEFDPGRKLVWEVRDSWLSFIEQTDEWDATEVHFDLSPVHGGGTEIRFTHVGLTPTDECYDACQSGWTHYIGDSLRLLVTEGAGDPHVPEAGIKDFESEALARYE
jgi:uncharacterized protein YndB with AHSA1/START domain